MIRRVVVLAAVAAALPVRAGELPRVRNIVLLTVDALRTDTVGHPLNLTPHITALAKRSVVFTNAYALSTITGYSVPGMFAARYPGEMRRNRGHLPVFAKTERFLPQILQEAGVFTAGFGSSWWFARKENMGRGFTVWNKKALRGGSYRNKNVDHVLANELIKFLDQPETRSQPFFAWAHFLDPHVAHLQHKGFRQFGKGFRGGYYHEVVWTDAQVGRVLEAIARHPKAAETAIVISADHGESLGGHGLFGHGHNLWEDVVRVPLIVWVPGLAPRTLDTPVSQIHLARTLLELMGHPAPAGFRGRSLLAAMAGRASVPPEPIFLWQPKGPFMKERRAWIQGTLKIHHRIEEKSFVLFDLRTDPDEKHDLSRERPADLARMKAAYEAFYLTLSPQPRGMKDEEYPWRVIHEGAHTMRQPVPARGGAAPSP